MTELKHGMTCAAATICICVICISWVIVERAKIDHEVEARKDYSRAVAVEMMRIEAAANHICGLEKKEKAQ